jgi:hypothetical protein
VASPVSEHLVIARLKDVIGRWRILTPKKNLGDFCVDFANPYSPGLQVTRFDIKNTSRVYESGETRNRDCLKSFRMEERRPNLATTHSDPMGRDVMKWHDEVVESLKDSW